jgi:hypothetical protein
MAFALGHRSRDSRHHARETICAVADPTPRYTMEHHFNAGLIRLMSERNV